MIDWEIKSFLKTILAIQVAMWVVVGLEAFGIHIPLVTELVGFIYLTFVPGIVILRALRLHKLGSVKTFLYSVGLSIATVMFGGLLTSAVGSVIEVSAPLSPLSLTLIFSIIVLGLCALSYLRDRDFVEPSHIEVRKILSPPVLFLGLLLSLSILGAFVLNHYQSNVLLLGVIAAIAVVVALIGFNRFIGKEYYPLAIFVFALIFLYYFQLSFPNFAGSDIHGEYYVARMTEINSRWDPNLMWLTTYGDMLSITILPAAYSFLLGMDVMGVFKLLYPFIFSLVPLALYEVYRHQTDERIGFLAAFFFISSGFFLAGMSYLTRMQVAELFFALLIMLAISKDLDPFKRVLLFIIFAISLVVSHYGLAYYFIFYLFLAWLLPIVLKGIMKQSYREGTLTVTLILLCLVATLSWYMYQSNALILRASVGIAEYLWENIADIFNPAARDMKLLQGLGLARVGMFEHSLLREVAAWFYRITYIMVIVGAVRWIVQRREMKFTLEYIGMTLAAMLTMLAALLVPHLSYSGMETNRSFHMALFLLAPFCILGGETILSGIKRLFLRIRKQAAASPMQQSTAHLLIIFLVLIPFFLFNTGFIFEVTGDPPGSLVLDKERLRISDNPMVRASFYNVTLRNQELSGMQWLSEHKRGGAAVYGDITGRLQLRAYSLIEGSELRVASVGIELDEGVYVYLRSFNINEQLVALQRPRRILGAGAWLLLYDIAIVLPELGKESLIYSNGGSEIYYIRNK